jgi:hypothetical protein
MLLELDWDEESACFNALEDPELKRFEEFTDGFADSMEAAL